MNRRELLEWVSSGLATAVATVVGLPGVGYFLGEPRGNHPANLNSRDLSK